MVNLKAEHRSAGEDWSSTSFTSIAFRPLWGKWTKLDKKSWIYYCLNFSSKNKKGSCKNLTSHAVSNYLFCKVLGKGQEQELDEYRNQLFYDLLTPPPFISPKMALSLKAFPWNKSLQFWILHKAVQNCRFFQTMVETGVRDKAHSSVVCGIRTITCLITWGEKLCSPWNTARPWRTQQKCL